MCEEMMKKSMGFCASTAQMNIGRSQRHNHPLQKSFPAQRTDPIPTLRSKHFINLTNGVEALRIVRDNLGVKDPMFIRLQSSLCEQAAYEKIILETDHNLLAHLATGHDCYVYDFASRSKRYGVPRAIWYGLEFIRFSCAYCWFGEDSPLVPDVILLRGKNVGKTWRHILRHEISKPVRQRLKYYREFVSELGVKEIRAFGVVGTPTILDGCKDLHAKMVRDSYESADLAQTDDLSDEQFRSKLHLHGLRIFDSNSSFEENILATSRNQSSN